MGQSIDRGEPDTFEVVWQNGHTDVFQAHQVSHPGGPMFGQPERIEFHGEFDGRWTLVLSASARDIRSVRNVTHAPDRLLAPPDA